MTLTDRNVRDCMILTEIETFELCEISAWLNLTWMIFTYLYARTLIFQVRNLVSF